MTGKDTRARDTKTTLLEIISGRRRGIVPAFARFSLGLLTPFYRLGVWYRNRGFDSGSREIHRARVPVISIGNITTGGTGKTPMVICVARLLRSLDLRVTIVSRGYGKIENAGDDDSRAAANDEALELEHRLPDVPHLQDADRSRIADVAVEELETQVILMDDGFQHRKLARDLDIVLIDALVPFGFGRLLPRGLLREPIPNLRRAHAIVLTRSDAVSKERRTGLMAQLKHMNPDAVFAQTKTVGANWMQYDGNSEPAIPGSGTAESSFAFCAIGNPEGFRHSLEQAGSSIAGMKEFPDHHRFSRQELESVAEEAKSAGATRLVCTHKDLVKVGVNRIGGLPVFALLVETVFVSGKDELDAAIRNAVIRNSAIDDDLE